MPPFRVQARLEPCYIPLVGVLIVVVAFFAPLSKAVRVVQEFQCRVVWAFGPKPRNHGSAHTRALNRPLRELEVVENGRDIFEIWSALDKSRSRIATAGVPPERRYIIAIVMRGRSPE